MADLKFFNGRKLDKDCIEIIFADLKNSLLPIKYMRFVKLQNDEVLVLVAGGEPVDKGIRYGVDAYTISGYSTDKIADCGLFYENKSGILYYGLANVDRGIMKENPKLGRNIEVEISKMVEAVAKKEQVREIRASIHKSNKSLSRSFVKDLGYSYELATDEEGFREFKRVPTFMPGNISEEELTKATGLKKSAIEKIRYKHFSDEKIDPDFYDRKSQGIRTVKVV